MVVGETADLSTALRSVEKHFQEGSAELQIPPLRFHGTPGQVASVGICDFFDFPVVGGRRAPKSICQQASPGSFDSAP